MSLHKRHAKLPPTPLSHELHRLTHLCDPELKLTWGEFFERLPTRSNSLLAFLLALPFLLPIPMPGLSVVFGVIIAVLGARTALGREPWIPKAWRRKPLPAATLLRILERAKSLIHLIEHVSRPRGEFMIHRLHTNVLSGAMISFCGVLLALPLFPGTNFPPATAILLLTTANLERDGLFLVLGTFAFTLNVVFFAALTVLGVEGLHALLN